MNMICTLVFVIYHILGYEYDQHDFSLGIINPTLTWDHDEVPDELPALPFSN